MRLPRIHKSLTFAALAALMVALTITMEGCTADAPDEVALATQCMRASDDNRVKYSASWLSSAKIEVDGGSITVRTEVPAGISIGGRVNFRYWVYRCRRHGDRVDFLGYEVRNSPGD